MTIRTKLLVGFGLLLLFMIGQAGVTYYYMSKSAELAEEAINRDFSTSLAIARVAIEGQKLRRFEKELFIYASDERRHKYYEEWKPSFDSLKALLVEMTNNKSGIWSDDDRQEIAKWNNALDEYGRGFNHVVAEINNGTLTRTVDANAAIKDAKDAFAVLLTGTEQARETKYQRAAASALQIDDNSRIINLVVLATSAAGMILAITLLITIPGSIAKPIEMLTQAAERMSLGDLSRAIVAGRSQEFQKLADTLERLRISQKALIDRLKARSA